MTTTTHNRAYLDKLATDIRRATTPRRDPRQRPELYERLLRLASRAHNHKLYGHTRAAAACKALAQRIVDTADDTDDGTIWSGRQA